MTDHPLIVSSQKIEELRSLRAQEKFGADGLYQASSEEVRLAATAHVDALLDRLIVGLPDKPSKYYVLAEFSAILEKLESSDTEDRERICECRDPWVMQL